MTITGHLTELRRRLFWMVLVFIVLAVICFCFIQRFVDMALSLSPQFSFVYLSPSELVTSYLKLALVLGLVFASPFILWQIWAFVQPGLTRGEKHAVSGAIVSGFVCFLIGAVFCYTIILPITLQFFYNFNGSKDITASISFINYLNFILEMLLAFGIIFEMPVLSFLLARLGVLKPKLLVKGRKFAILIIFILAAIITPPDVVSQLMAAVPMILLYEVSIVVARKAYKKHELAEEMEEEGTDDDDGDEEDKESKEVANAT